MFRWAWDFYGLTPSDKVNLFLEELFIVTYYGGWTLTEAYKAPVPVRKWFIQRLLKEINKTDSEGNPVSQTRALHQNTPQQRSIQGMTNPHSPSRTRRFT